MTVAELGERLSSRELEEWKLHLGGGLEEDAAPVEARPTAAQSPSTMLTLMKAHTGGHRGR